MSSSTLTTANEPSAAEPRTSLPTDRINACEALIIALNSRRIVIVRSDEKVPIWSAEQICRPIRYLRSGEPVYYKGKRDVVRAIATY